MDRQLLLFELGGETYGIDVIQARSIIPMPEITRVPGAPAFIEGVTNLRGEVIPVVNLRTRFDLPLAEEIKKTVIIIAEVRELQVGMVVDRVLEVTRIQQTAIDPPSPLFSGIDQAYLHGIGKQGETCIILLDLNRIFSTEEYQELSQTV